MECPALSEKEFQLFQRLIYQECGINLTPNKKVMLAGRLIKRLLALGLATFAEYLAYLATPAALERKELISLIDAVSTNKTDFFREPDHFDFLAGRLLPGWLEQERDGLAGKVFRVWSAGCSTGEEAFTLAMVLDEFRRLHDGFEYRILASDISTRVLRKAARAVYEDERVSDVPAPYLHRYFMKGKGEMAGCHRVVPELRQRIEIGRINFLADDFGVRDMMDVIFCRNVLIYFDRLTQQKVIANITRHLAIGGCLFTGHSESVLKGDGSFERMAPSVYRKKA